MAVPGSFIALAVHFLFHGFFLDVLIIGVVPFLSSELAAKSRKALFPWCLGGYPGYGSEIVPNLAPTHRRFMTENAVYAILRGGAGVYVLCNRYASIAALLLAVVSHFIEASTIAWELFAHAAPPDAAPPMTLMGIFSTWTMITVHYNQGDYLLLVDDYHMNALYAFVGLTWASWLVGVVGIIKNKGKRSEVTVS